MNPSTRRFVSRQFTILLLCVIVGLILLWYAADKGGKAGIFLANVACIVLTAGPFAWLGAYQARLDVLQSLGAMGEFAGRLTAAGIRDVRRWPIDIPSRAAKIDIYVIRASHWLPTKLPALRDILNRKKARVRICLLHPQSAAIAGLAEKFGEDPLQVVAKIRDTTASLIGELIRGRTPGATSTVEVRFQRKPPTYTYYRIDDAVHVVWYSMKAGTQNPPLLDLQDGWLEQHFAGEFEEIWNSAVTGYDVRSSNEENATRLAGIGFTPDELRRARLRE